jgi:hypothetical protein
MTNPYKSNMFLHVLECFANSRDIGESEIWKFAAKDLKICSSSPSKHLPNTSMMHKRGV